MNDIAILFFFFFFKVVFKKIKFWGHRSLWRCLRDPQCVGGGGVGMGLRDSWQGLNGWVCQNSPGLSVFYIMIPGKILHREEEW